MNDCIKNNLTPVEESAMEPMNEGIKDVVVGATSLIGGSKTVVDVVKGTGKIGSKLMKFKPLRIVAIIIAGGIAVIGLIKLICKLTFWCMKQMMKLSDWFEIQATYLQINAENLKYREDNKGDDHRKRVYQSQMKWVDRFKKLANFFALKDSKATKETEDEERRNRNRTYDDDEDYDDDESMF